MIEGEHSPREVAKFIAVVSGIFAASILLTAAFGSFTFTEWARWFMGVFFLVFASFKLIGYQMFAMMFAGYDVIAKRLKIYAHLYPFIELGLAALYIFDAFPTGRDILTLMIMSVGTIGVAQEIKKRSGVHCACLGNIIRLPLSTVSLVEDVGMALMALLMLVLN